MCLVAFKNNSVQRGKQLNFLYDAGSLNRKILFIVGMGRGRRSKHKNARVKVQNDIRMSTHMCLSTNIERACLVRLHKTTVLLHNIL